MQLLIFIILIITSCYSSNLLEDDKEFYNSYKNLNWNTINLTSSEKEWIEKNHTIRVSLGIWPPYMFWENDIPKGIVVDYLKIISYKMNLNIEFIERKDSFEKTKLLLIEAKEIDIMPMITNTLDRRPYISFTKDYIVQPWVIITKDDEDFVGDLEYLKGKSLAVTEGYFYIDILKEKYPEIKLITFKSDEDALKAVSSYKANAYIGVIPVSTYMFNKHNLLNLKIAASTNLPDDTNAIGIRKDWPELTSIIDKSFDAMKPEIHNFVKQNYISVKYEYGISSWDIAKWIGIIIFVFSLILIAISLVNRKLTYEIKEKKRLQEGLEKELELKNKLLLVEEQFNRFFQLSINLQLIASTDGIIKQLNSAWKSILGYDNDDIINTSFLNLVHPNDLEATINEMSKLSKEENVYFFENRFIHKDGYYINLAWSATIDDSNNLIYGTAQDLTEFKKKDLLFDYIINAIPDILWMKNNDGIYMQCNHRFEEFFGDCEKNIIGKTDYDYISKELADFFRENDKEAMNSHTPIVNYETIPFASDGHKEYIQTIKRVVINKEGENIGILGIGRDFTSFKQDQDKLLKQKMELETMFKSVMDGIAVIDFDRKFINCNDAFVKFTGFSYEEILTKTCRELTLEEDREKNDKAIQYAIENGYIKDIEKRCIIKNGTITTVSMSISLLPDEKKLLLVIRDMTQVKLFEAQSKMATMGEMLGNIAHQWRQPLSSISTAATGIKLQKELDILKDEDIIHNMDLINSSAQYLSKTIDDFRNFLNPSNNSTSHFLISNTFDKTINLIKAQFVAKEIEIIKNIDSISILSIENELIQVLINILNNSRDALINVKNQKRYIFINVYKKENNLVIEIKDNAKGIPEDIIHRIFEPYFTTKHQSQGTGIGLYMSEQITRTHLKGIVSVKNSSYHYEGTDYKGALFTIKIPMN